MDTKQIQEERIREYFIQATKKILRGEGLKAINVRNIAKEAGYSYATLYNYFKDVKDLVFECVKDFQDECNTFIQEQVKGSQYGIPRIKKITLSYITYFVQYPGIFELFYLEKMGDLSGKKPTIKLIVDFHNEITKSEWQNCIEKNICTEQEAKIKQELLKNLTVGILIFYINRYTPKDYKEFLALAESQIENILK